MADRFPGDEIDAVLVVSFVDPVDTAAKVDVIAKNSDSFEICLPLAHLVRWRSLRNAHEMAGAELTIAQNSQEAEFSSFGTNVRERKEILCRK